MKSNVVARAPPLTYALQEGTQTQRCGVAANELFLQPAQASRKHMGCACSRQCSLERPATGQQTRWLIKLVWRGAIQQICCHRGTCMGDIRGRLLKAMWSGAPLSVFAAVGLQNCLHAAILVAYPGHPKQWYSCNCSRSHHRSAWHSTAHPSVPWAPAGRQRLELQTSASCRTGSPEDQSPPSLSGPGCSHSWAAAGPR